MHELWASDQLKHAQRSGRAFVDLATQLLIFRLIGGDNSLPIRAHRHVLAFERFNLCGERIHAIPLPIHGLELVLGRLKAVFGKRRQERW